MKRSTFLALIAILSLTLFLRALPFFQHIFWGMDEGEYLVMSRNIVNTGAISTDYNGWTVAYPYFQGFFVLSAAFSSISSISVLDSLGLVIIFSILAPISVFLMTSKIMGESAGIAASAFMAVAAPYAYHSSLPAPESLGGALLVGSLLMLWKGGKKSVFVCLILATAMVVSHPLSGYIFLLFLGGSTLVRILKGNRWKEIWFLLLVYSTILLLYWMLAGKGFREGVLTASGVSPIYVVVSAYLALLSLYILGKTVKRPLMKDALDIGRAPGKSFFLLLMAVMALLALSVFVKVPGLATALEARSLLFFSPFILLIILSLYGFSLLKASGRGIEVWGWITAISSSALAGYFLNAHLLIPYRHLEYMMIPFAIFFGASVYLLLLRSPETGRARALLPGIIAAFLLVNSLVVYPPAGYVGNFSESTDADEIPAITAASHLDGMIVTDHRLSADAFAMGNERVSWEEAGNFFRDPWNSTYAGDYILLTKKMCEGAVFGSGKPAEKVEDTFFLRCYLVYEDSAGAVYLWNL